MANQKISALTTIPAVDANADFLPIVDTSGGTSNKVTLNGLLGITGSPVGTNDSQALSNKTIGNTNTVTLKASLFLIQDQTDTTKQAKFDASGITTATTRTYALPDANTTLVGTGVAQTLTNKTLTSPTINGGTIDNSTITVDAISGHTSANTMTVAGIVIISSVLPQSALPLGAAVQTASSLLTAVATGTTVIPLDDTIPQITEGDQYMTVSITPKSATNTLNINIFALIGHSTATAPMIIALFQDATANALAATDNTSSATATAPSTFSLQHTLTAGTTSSTTFRVRIGSNSAGTTTVNGQAGSRLFGAITKSSIVVTEYRA